MSAPPSSNPILRITLYYVLCEGPPFKRYSERRSRTKNQAPKPNVIPGAAAEGLTFLTKQPQMHKIIGHPFNVDALREPNVDRTRDCLIHVFGKAALPPSPSEQVGLSFEGGPRAVTRACGIPSQVGDFPMCFVAAVWQLLNIYF